MNRQVTVFNDRQTFLFCSKSVKGQEMSEPFTHISAKGMVETSWNVDVEESGEYIVGLAYQSSGKRNEVSISSGDHHLHCVLDGTSGPFLKNEINFCHTEIQKPMFLEKGCREIKVSLKNEGQKMTAISFIDLYPFQMSAEQFRDIQEARKMTNLSWRKAGNYGLMFHWTAESCPEAGDKLDYQEAVKQFNTEKFAEMVKSTGASYVIFTMNHAIEHFPAPLEEWESYFKGMTTSRDLVEDLYQSLEKRGIDLMLYLNFTAAYQKSKRSGLKYNEHIIHLAENKREDFTIMMKELLTAIGKRYGNKVKGYWIDSCYQLIQQFGTFDFRGVYLASKEGWEQRAVTFNHWILPVVTPWNDYWAGETAEMIHVPDTCYPLDGPAPGIYFQNLIIMEDDWGNFTPDRKIPNPVYMADDLLEYMQKMKKINAMLTINAEIYQEGDIADRTLTELQKFGRTWKEEIQ